MDVLICLALEAGKLASKQNIIDAVWRTEFVSEHALTQVVAELRSALGDDARNPIYIENIPRRGYRLVATVTPVAMSVPSARDASLPFKLQGDDGDHPLMPGAEHHRPHDRRRHLHRPHRGLALPRQDPRPGHHRDHRGPRQQERHLRQRRTSRSARPARPTATRSGSGAASPASASSSRANPP